MPRKIILQRRIVQDAESQTYRYDYTQLDKKIHFTCRNIYSNSSPEFQKLPDDGDIIAFLRHLL